MANLNLSEFTEKLFVADADHTFIWDTANAISKRVSRNSWLNSGTLTSDAPVTISQTWNQIGTAFTAFKINAVSTASASGSLLLDLQLGGTSKASFNKDGSLTIGGGNISDGGFGFLFKGFGVGSFFVGQNGAGTGAVAMGSGSSFGFSSLGTPTGLTLDTILLRDGAPNTLALRNGAAAQTFNVYGTSSASNANYARLALTCGLDGNATISTQALGTGTAGTVSINGVPVGRGKGSVDGNIAIGSASLNSFSTGFLSIAIGADALKLITASQHNTAIGGNTLSKITSGNNNTSIGSNSMQAITSGSDNTSLGLGTFEFLTSGSNNVIIGSLAGKNTAASASLTTCNNSILIGNATRVELIGQTNQIVIGDQATGIGSNSVVLGNDSITKTALKGNVGIGTTNPISAAGSTLLTISHAGVAGVYWQNTSAVADTRNWNFLTNGINFEFQSVNDAISSSTVALRFNRNSGLTTINSVEIPSSRLIVGGTGNTTIAGNVGIGTTSPTSKLQVTGGDVEIETVTSGIIMKAAGTSTRYRITLNAGGTALVFTAI